MRIARTFKIAPLAAFVMAWSFVGLVAAKLPPPSDEAKAKAAEAAAKSAHATQVAAYELCKAQDKAAAKYMANARKAGKKPEPATATAPCVNPGPAPGAAPPAKPAAKKA